MRYIFSYFLKKTCCGYSSEVPRGGASNEHSQHMHIFSSRNKKTVSFRASKSWLDKWLLVPGQ